MITQSFPYEEQNGKNNFTINVDSAKKIASRITLRHFIKLAKRIISLYDHFAKAQNKSEYISLHAYFLYPNDVQIKSMKAGISSQITA
jgi:RPA family protein